jgi:tetratricopeptide (TPR) repeat protein
MQAVSRRKTSLYLSQCPNGHVLQLHVAENVQCSICCAEFLPDDCSNCLQCLICKHEICAKCQILILHSSNPSAETKHLFELANAFFQLAALYYAAGNIYTALELDEQVLSIRRKILPAFHIQLGESLHNLAHSYFDLQRYEDSLAMRIEELQIFQHSLPESDARITECMEQLGQTHSALGQAEDAFRCDFAVLRLRRQNNDEHHPEIIAALINLSTSYLELGEWAEAIPCLEEALLSQEITLSPDDEDICKTMMQLVQLYTQGNQMAAAIKMQKKVLKFWRLYSAPGSIETILAKVALAKLREDTGSYNEAHKLNVEVVEMCDSGIASMLENSFWKKYIAAISGD